MNTFFQICKIIEAAKPQSNDQARIAAVLRIVNAANGAITITTRSGRVYTTANTSQGIGKIIGGAMGQPASIVSNEGPEINPTAVQKITDKTGNILWNYDFGDM